MLRQLHSLRRSKLISDPVAFDIPIKKQKELYNPLMKKGNLDLEIDQYISNTKPSEILKKFQIDPLKYAARQKTDHIKKTLKPIFQQLGKTLQLERDHNLEIDSIAISLKAFIKKKHPSKMDALKNIAKTISEYKAERLFKDQTSKIVSFLTCFCLFMWKVRS
jgi:hypothetical protein